MSDNRITVYLINPTNSRNIHLQWLDPLTGKRVSRSARTADEDEAERVRKDLEYELNHGMVTTGQAVTWASFLDSYDKQHLAVHVKPAGRLKTVSVLKKFAALMKINLARDVDEGVVARYAARLKADGYVVDSIATYLAHLRAALRWAEEHRLISRVPRIRLPPLPQRRFIERTDRAGLDKLLAACPDEPWRVFIQTGWHAGLRLGELFYLRTSRGEWPWIDLEQRRIYFPASSCKADRDDWVPIHEELLPLLVEYTQDMGEGQRLFPLYRWRQHVSRMFTRIARKAGVKITLHGLRRSFGTRCAQIMPAQRLQRLMRHASITTTLKYYVDLDDGLEEALNRLK